MVRPRIAHIGNTIRVSSRRNKQHATSEQLPSLPEGLPSEQMPDPLLGEVLQARGVPRCPEGQARRQGGLAVRCLSRPAEGLRELRSLHASLPFDGLLPVVEWQAGVQGAKLTKSFRGA